VLLLIGGYQVLMALAQPMYTSPVMNSTASMKARVIMMAIATRNTGSLSATFGVAGVC